MQQDEFLGVGVLREQFGGQGEGVGVFVLFAEELRQHFGDGGLGAAVKRRLESFDGLVALAQNFLDLGEGDEHVSLVGEFGGESAEGGFGFVEAAAAGVEGGG